MYKKKLEALFHSLLFLSTAELQFLFEGVMWEVMRSPMNLL